MKPRSTTPGEPRRRGSSTLIAGLALLAGLAPLHAIDATLKPVADGNQNYRGSEPNTTSSWSLHAEYAESTSIYSTGRRIVLKFDTSSLTGTELRNAKLYLFGGCSSATPVLTKVYRYSNDNWTDTNVPYPLNAHLQYLAQKTVSNVLTADYIGTSEWHAYDIGSSLSGWEPDGYLSIALRNLTPNPPSAISAVTFISRNTVTWNGSRGKEPYLAVETWSDAGVANPSFNASTSSMIPWSSEGSGSAQLITDPNDAANQIAELTAGSPVSISQVLDTPADPFYVRVSHEFKSVDGTLTVSLTQRDGTETVIGSMTAPGVLEPGLKSEWLEVNTPSLLAADHVTLELSFDGASGSQVWIDEVAFTLEGAPSPGAGFRVTSLTMNAEGDQLEVTWASEPSASYTLETSTDMTPGSWTEIETGIPSQGTSTTHSVAVTSSPRLFVRVVEDP